MADEEMKLILTLEQRPDFCNVRKPQCSPLLLRNGLEFFDAIFTDW